MGPEIPPRRHVALSIHNLLHILEAAGPSRMDRMELRRADDKITIVHVGHSPNRVGMKVQLLAFSHPD